MYNKYMNNVSKLDKVLRILIATALSALSIYILSGVWQILALGVAVVLLVTSVTGKCPLYKALNINTKK